MELPKRKQVRLAGYDYSSCGAYFVTICVADKRHLLWNVGANCVRPDKLPRLSDIGKIVDAEIQKLETIYEKENGRTQFAPTVSRIIIRNQQGYCELCGEK